MVEDLVLLGLHEEAAAYAKQLPHEFELWPEHETTWQVFTALATQWNTVVLQTLDGTSIRYKGIDYTGARSTLEMMGIKRKKWPEIFEGLRIMELAALPIMNE